MKPAAFTLAAIAFFCAVMAYRAFDGVDNGTVLAMWVIGLVVSASIAAVLCLWNALA